MKSLSKNSIYYLLYNVLNIAFPFISGVYAAQILLPETIGTVTAAKNVAQYFCTLAFLGIPTYGLREIARVRDNQLERDKVYSELFVINLISTIIFLAIYLGLITAVPKYRTEYILYLVVGISIALNAFNNGWLFEGMEEFRFMSVRNLVFKAASLAFLVLFVKSEDDVLLYALVSIIGTAGNNIVNMFYAPKFAKFTLKGLNLRRHMKSIFYLVAVNLAIELYSLVDVTMMNFMCEKDSIAFYRYGQNIQSILLRVINTFTMVLVPRISFYYKDGNMPEFNRVFSKTLRIIIIAALPTIVGVFFTADFLIVQLYGDAYIVSARVLKIAAPLMLLSPIGYLLGSRVLLASGNEKRMIIPVGVGAGVNIVCNALLIPRFGEYGAMTASLISETVVMIVYVMMGKKYFHLEGITLSAWKVMAASAAMGAYLFVCSRLPLGGWAVVILQIAGGMLVFGISMLLMREEIVNEYWKMIRAKFGKVLRRVRHG